MMQKKRNGKLQKGIMVAVSALTVLASASTALAYQPMQSSDMSFNDIMSDSSQDYFGYDAMSLDMIDIVDFSKGDNVFVSLDGKQTVVDNQDIPYALCTHSMVDGYFYSHASNSSGGCTIKVYTCQRCKKCGYLANAVYSHTTTYAKCPH